MSGTFDRIDADTSWIGDMTDGLSKPASNIQTDKNFTELPGAEGQNVFYERMDAYEVAFGDTPTCIKMDNPAAWIADNQKDLIDFKEYASSIRTAIGLAANQVNLFGRRLDQRFFVMESPDGWKVYIDPTIVEYHGESYEALEECLSFPGRKLSAERFRRITVSYWTLNGTFIENAQMKKLEAQVFQHETDHLDGVAANVVSQTHFTFKNKGDKVGRNEPCPCGSGKKFKKCCL